MARRSHDSKRIEWAERLRRHAGSGLSISAFCRKHSMSEALFHYWKRRLRESGDWPQSVASPSRSESPRFVELRERGTGRAPCVEIGVGDLTTIRIPADHVAAIQAAVGVVMRAASRPGENADNA